MVIYVCQCILNDVVYFYGYSYSNQVPSRLQCRKKGFHFIKTIYPENGVCSFARTFNFELYKSMLGVLYSKEERRYFSLSPQFGIFDKALETTYSASAS